MQKEQSRYLIYTDGSHRFKDGRSCGAFAFLIYDTKQKRIVDMRRQGYFHTTVNVMELRAIYRGLQVTPSMKSCIYSDSIYSIRAYTVWPHIWRKNNWVGMDQTPVKNQDIIRPVLDMRDFSMVKFEKVAAHSGDRFNTLVDYLAHSLTGRMLNMPYPEKPTALDEERIQ